MRVCLCVCVCVCVCPPPRLLKTIHVKCAPLRAKHSGSKCFEQSSELVDGLSQLFCCCLMALIHLLRTLSSRGNVCKLGPSPLLILHPAATQRLGIVLGLLAKNYDIPAVKC